MPEELTGIRITPEELPAGADDELMRVFFAKRFAGVMLARASNGMMGVAGEHGR